ncbi:hypothetical protein QMK19_33535 [Streptomyces sp. H10-C2]|uniref:hypothetical protein n=1 Tax=unclassified Streptomyces TaxID=2593676 RepID=UPI0024B9FC92|nr:MULTISPECIES: hypothetical protein [unclassified Streptomyces]MDJ0347070.1 hypothetical protein [Streptomyces sp. PH10-H1]MDJ0374416.1 hypothetical protein [Streptomyces sp. H10-C2]
MSDGFIYWYETDWSAPRVVARLAELEKHGLLLANPESGVITEISDDWDTLGNQVVVQRADLLRHAVLDDSTELTFQFWITGATDVICRVRRVKSNIVVHEFGLDGLTAAELANTVRVLYAEVGGNLTHSLGWIADTIGASEEVNWDAVVTGDKTPIRPVPDILIIPHDIAAEHPELAAMPSHPLGDLVVHTRPGHDERIEL